MDAAQVTLHHGDCLDVLRTLPPASVDAVVTDPPYELAFMGRQWDSTGIAYSVELWAECLRILSPGGHLASFGGSRTYHRMACAIEDAGFEIRDGLQWLYGSGMAKGLNVGKAIDRIMGGEREVIGTKRSGMSMHDNLNDDGWHNAGRGEAGKRIAITAPATSEAAQWEGWNTSLAPAHEPIVLARRRLTGTVAQTVLAHGTGAINVEACRTPEGRWPKNVIIDDHVAADLGHRAQYFYCAKALTAERPVVNGVAHPTPKPLTLMRWLARLVTRPGGTILDPFAGSGTTLEAAMLEGFHVIGIEREADYLPLIEHRIDRARATLTAEPDDPGLFDVPA